MWLCKVSLGEFLSWVIITTFDLDMAEYVDSEVARADTTEDIIGAIDLVLGAENSDKSQIVGLQGLSLESASNGEPETPLPQGGDNPQKKKQRNTRKPKRLPNQAKGPPTQVAYSAVPAPVLDWPSRGQDIAPQSFPPPQKGPGKILSWSLTGVIAPQLSCMPVGCWISPLRRRVCPIKATTTTLTKTTQKTRQVLLGTHKTLQAVLTPW